MQSNENTRHGSAAFADLYELRDAGLHQRGGLYIGDDERGKPIFSDGQAPVLLMGGARSGKGNFIIPWLIDGSCRDHVISMDWKGQNGAVSALQVDQNRRVINFAPRADTTHRINPLSHLKDDSPTLIPDAKLFIESWLPFNGSENAEYFIATGQRWIEAVLVTLVEIYGDITLPELATAMGLFGGDDDIWLGIEEAMARSHHGSVAKVAAELLSRRNGGHSNAGGFTGAMGEVSKSFACMSDPQIQAAVSPPFDFCFSDLTKDGAPAYIVNIQEAMEYAKTSGPVVKALYTCALIYKRRALGSRPQLWLLDEIGNIGAWPMAMDLATYGPSFGIRPAYVVQSTAQFDNLYKDASGIIPNSCATQIYMGVRDLKEAQRLSHMLGMSTEEYEDFVTNERARIARQQAVTSVFMDGNDPFHAGLELGQQGKLAEHKASMSRALMQPDEILNMPGDQALVMLSGRLEHPLRVRFKRYWERRDLAGKFLPDPFHGDGDTVSLRSFWGQRTRPVVTEDVPARFADWPQYSASGKWTYVEGYRQEG